MPATHSNLISDSALLGEIIDMVRAAGEDRQIVSTTAIAASVFRIPDLDAELATRLVADLVGDDARLRLTEDHTVQLANEDADLRPLRETAFVVVDVETTGTKTPPGRVTEIGAYRVERGNIVAEFETLVNPETPIPPFISALTGITDRMVAGAPRFGDVAHDWLRFAGDAVLVAHNAPFDVRFLNHELGRLYPGRRMGNAQLCTVTLSRRLLPGLANHRLHTVAEHFAIRIARRHRAAGDARATAEIFIRLLDQLERRGVTCFAQLKRSRSGNRNGDETA